MQQRGFQKLEMPQKGHWTWESVGLELSRHTPHPAGSLLRDSMSLSESQAFICNMGVMTYSAHLTPVSSMTREKCLVLAASTRIPRGTEMTPLRKCLDESAGVEGDVPSHIPTLCTGKALEERHQTHCGKPGRRRGPARCQKLCDQRREPPTDLQ